MKTLLVLRHAKSSWKDLSLADHDRPLNKRGRADAPRMGRFLDEQGLPPDRILCSTARRARQTAKRVVRGGAFDCAVELVHRMYDADADDLAETLHGAPDDARCLMIIGHNPGLEEFVARLTGELVTLPTAAVARIAIDVDAWSEVTADGRATLGDVWRPREVAQASAP